MEKWRVNNAICLHFRSKDRAPGARVTPDLSSTSQTEFSPDLMGSWRWELWGVGWELGPENQLAREA